MITPFQMDEVEALFESHSFKDYLKKVDEPAAAVVTEAEDKETEEEVEEEQTEETGDEEMDDDMENMREAVINFLSLDNKDYKDLKESDPDLFEELCETCSYICGLKEDEKEKED